MAPLPDGASDALTTWIYDIGWKIARTLPEPVANATFRQIADVIDPRGERIGSAVGKRCHDV